MTARSPDGSEPLRIAVIGGGFTGAVFAIHALRTANSPIDITIIDPREQLGRGIAYSATDPDHRINVPTDRMSVIPEDSSHATRWFFDQGILPDAGSSDGRGYHYVPRRAYGNYVGAVLQRSIEDAGPRARVRHHRAVASDVEREGDAWSVALSDGSSVVADKVLLCFGHALPTVACPVSDAARRHPRFVPNPWAAHAFDSVDPDNEVLIVGTGLTMADAAASLMARGHTGVVTAISRHGLLPRPHGLFLDGIDILAGEAPPRTALGLLRLLRRRVRHDDHGVGWQALADALRSRLPDLWGGLPQLEKRKVLRRLLPYWEVHRFRIAPQIHAALDHALEGGRLRVERAAIMAIDRDADRLVATLRFAHQAERDVRRSFGAVILCTGPDKNPRRNPLLSALLERGFGRLDPVELGLAVDRQSRLLDRAGSIQGDLFALGPMTRGTFGEMTGAPDITRHIQAVVGDVLAR